MFKSMILDFADFKILLHNFDDLVCDKHYDKMDYHMWRKISSTPRPYNAYVFIEWNNYTVDIAFEEDSEWHHFVFGDNSFGDFIWENLLKNSEYEICPESKRKKTREITQSTPSNKCEYDAYKLSIAANEAIANGNDKTKAAKERLLAAVPYNGVITTSTSEPTIALTIDTKVDKAEFDSKLKALSEKIQAVTDKCNNNDKKESSIMNGFKFDFGPANANTVRMSMYGLAVKNKTGAWVSYDTKSGEIMDVDILNFEGAQFIWRMPVAIKDIAIGDVIVHQGVPMFVVAIPEGGKVLTVVDPIAGERKDIMLLRSPFGFNFATKVVNFLGDMFGGAASADNPFGNMWMLMAMQSDGKSFDPNMLMPLMFANQGNMDPTMMMVFMAMGQGNSGKVDMNSIFPLMWAVQNMNKSAAHVCNCGQCNQ